MSITGANNSENEPEFIKKFGAYNLDVTTVSTSDTRGISTTHDVIGKHLKQFYKPGNSVDDYSDVPQVFIQIYDYFDMDENRYKVKDLFKKLSIEELKQVDRLE